MRQLLPWALALCCGCASSSSSSGAFSGTIKGRAFAAIAGQARASADRRIIDLADYAIDCANPKSGASVGSRFVSVVLDPYRGPGEYVLSGQPLGAEVSASVTTWTERDGALFPESLILTTGRMTIGDGPDGGLAGEARLGTRDADIGGRFSVSACP